MKNDPISLIKLPGYTPYVDAWNLQKQLVERRCSNEIADTIVLLEHEPVITLGRNADNLGVVASRELLRNLGIEVIRIERGGQATYHGPGQVIGYPILSLRDRGIGVAEYVRSLERVMLQVASELGIETLKREGITGVFTEKGKLGAIGVRIQKGVSFHGFAFNRDPNLEHYKLIVPCGMADIPPCSCAQLIDPTPSANRVEQIIINSFAQVFNSEVIPVDS